MKGLGKGIRLGGYLPEVPLVPLVLVVLLLPTRFMSDW
jgi:hypothetical protein